MTQPVDPARSARRVIDGSAASLFQSSSEGPREADNEVLRGLPNLVHLGAELRDFADTAAVISLLDVVISVDTSVAHLAGALGKPVSDPASHAADFRWMAVATTPMVP